MLREGRNDRRVRPPRCILPVSSRTDRARLQVDALASETRRRTGGVLPTVASRMAVNEWFPSELTTIPLSQRRLETRMCVFQKFVLNTVTGWPSSCVRRAMRCQKQHSAKSTPHEQRYVSRSTLAVSPVAAPIDVQAG